jgi:hypothetical protein
MAPRHQMTKPQGSDSICVQLQAQTADDNPDYDFDFEFEFKSQFSQLPAWHHPRNLLSQL